MDIGILLCCDQLIDGGVEDPEPAEERDLVVSKEVEENDKLAGRAEFGTTARVTVLLRGSRSQFLG